MSMSEEHNENQDFSAQPQQSGDVSQPAGDSAGETRIPAAPDRQASTYRPSPYRGRASSAPVYKPAPKDLSSLIPKAPTHAPGAPSTGDDADDSSQAQPVKSAPVPQLQQPDPILKLKDPRYMRSRELIRHAFFDLVEERGIDNVTVADIADRAGINRSTFYSHYSDKEDMLRSYEEDFLPRLVEIAAKIRDITAEDLAKAFIGVEPLKVLVELFEYLGHYQRELHALLGPNGNVRFEHELLDTVCNTLVNRVLDDKYSSNPTPLVNYYVAYFSSASLGVVRQWIMTGAKESPEEMASIFMHLAFISPGDPIEMDGDLSSFR